jgi:hypothetical protein
MSMVPVEEPGQLEDPALKRVALFFVLFLSMISIATPGSVSLLLERFRDLLNRRFAF